MERTLAVDMIAKLPGMADAALAVLRANAERLGRTGTKAQKSAAAALMPAIEAEIDARRAAKLGKARKATPGRRDRKTGVGPDGAAV
jgi:hypothetical protein